MKAFKSSGTHRQNSGGGEKTIVENIGNNTSEYNGIDVNKLISDCSYSKESLRELYNMFKSKVFAIGFGITSDYYLAEDCVAETFVRLAQTKNFNPEKGDGVGYIITMARNIAFELRRQHRHDDDSIIIQSYGVADHTVENSIYINELLMYLSDSLRQVVIMRCICDLPFKKIARIMKCPESSVKYKYNKAMAILKKKAGVNSER